MLLGLSYIVDYSKCLRPRAERTFECSFIAMGCEFSILHKMKKVRCQRLDAGASVECAARVVAML